MRSSIRGAWGWVPAAALLGVPLSQLGHALVYLCRFGAAGLRFETEGVHGYFPQLLGLSAGVVGAAVLTCLVLGGLGRIAAGRGMGMRPLGGQRPSTLLVAAASVQLAVYVIQETVESAFAGGPLQFGWLVSMLAWGLVGQLPIALLAAVGLAWLSIRFDAGIARFRSLWQACDAWLPSPPLVTDDRRPAPGPVARPTRVAPAILPERGPPLSLAM
jgi:hypothetical protein